MHEQIMKELEAAAKILLAPPNVVNHQQRQAAADVFANFKRTNSPYIVCRYILDESKVDYVLFEVADALKEALIREWKLLQRADVNSLLQYLLMYVTGRAATLPVFVREKILQVIAIAIKRRSSEDDGAQRAAFLTEIENMIFGGDHHKQLLGCSMISALVQEYAISSKSSDIGLTMKLNYLVKEHFELTDLKKVFEFCIKALSNLAAVEPPFPDTTEAVFKQLLSLSEIVLTWNFTPPGRLFTTSNYQANNTPKLKLPQTWKDVVLDNKVVNLYFTVYWKIRHIPSLGHHGLSCLVQFASLHGPIFDSEESRYAYLNIYIEGFLKLVQNSGIMDREAVGISNIAREIMSFLPDVLLPGLQPALIECFLEQLTVLTCNFAEGAALEETGRSDDRLYMEAFDHMTESWVNVLNIDTEPWKNVCKNSATRIFTVYVKCHLAFPAGTRIDRHPELEEYGEAEEPDRVRFRDQLQNIGEFGRHCLEFSIPWVANLQEQRITSLRRLLDALKADGTKNISNSGQFFPTFEDLNWLILISGSILSYGTSEIPVNVMKYSVFEAPRTHVEYTVFEFTTPGERLGYEVDPDRRADPVIRLMVFPFRLAYMFKRFIDIRMEMFLSPELVSTTLWFLKRWTTTYLMFNEQVNEQLSMPFVCSFGRDSEGGVWAVNFLLEHLISLLVNLHVEPDVVEQSVNLFIALVDNKEKGRHVLKSESLKALMTMLPNLRFGIKREVVRGLTLAGAALAEPSKDNEYWVQVLKPIRDRLYSLMSRDDFQRNYHSEAVKSEVLDVLDCLIGVAMGSSSSTIPIIFRYLSPVMIVMPELMHTYHNYQQVVELILLALVKCATHFVSYLPHTHSKNLYEASLYTIQEYSKLNANRLTLDASSEEDCFTDLLLIMELLSNLFTKDIFDFSRSDVVEVVERPLVAADVCLFGLNLVMPLVRTELLRYPELSLQYYKLISYVCQFYPGKVMNLEEKMLHTVLRSIEFGLNSASEEIIPYCCDFIQFLGIHLFTIAEGSPTNPILKPFLKILMNMALTYRLNDNYLPKTSGALFAMICCYEEDYTQLVQSTLDNQPEEAVKQLLLNAFKSLTENIPLKIHRQSQNTFRKNFENFVLDIRGFFTG